MPSASVEPPRGRILSLPEEILDQICEEVRLLKPDRLIVFSTLCSWSFTCRAFARSGQRALYRAPFSLRPAFDPFVTAPKFRQALESNATLGKFVHTLDLRFFTEFVYVNVRGRDRDFKEGKGYLHEGCLPAFDALLWQQRIVELCPNVRSVHVYLLEEAAPGLGTALAGSSQPQKLRMGIPARGTVPTSVAAFLPFDPSHLTSLSISTPNPAFSSLPSLCTLTLRNGRDMTLDKLDLLVQTSSSLEHIDLGRTKWSFPHSDSPSASLDTLARRSLARFPRLRTALLGYYPESAGAPAAERKEGKGFEVVWQREGDEGDEDLEKEWDRDESGESIDWELEDDYEEDEEEGGDGEDKEEE
ncbi:hypothetical protein JCM8097_006730 [Rhodosporidiobolus ruineniae]